MSAYYYWPEEATLHLGVFSDLTEAAMEFKKLVDEGHVNLKELRSRGKRISSNRRPYTVMYIE